MFWLSHKLEDVPEGNDWLSAAEQAVLATKKFPKRINEWRLGRWTAKQAVCRYLGFSPALPSLASIEIRAAADGAPEPFRQDRLLPVSLSISHSAGLSFCVVGPPESALGCDLEEIRPLFVNFVRDYFAAEEAALLENLSSSEREQYALLIWSAKESALKSLREGLRRDTRSVVVSLDRADVATEWNRLTARCTVTSRTFHGWWQIYSGYVKAITSAHSGTAPRELD